MFDVSLPPTLVERLIFAAGAGQLALAAASLAIPRILGWKQELQRVSPLTRRLFWVYAAYILGTNVCFGLVSALAPGWLTDATPLAVAVSGFIAVYWGARLMIQFTLFAAARPPGALFRLAESGLAALFVFLTVVYATAAVTGFGRLA